MRTFTEEEAKVFLNSPFIKFSAVASFCFPGSECATQRLKTRTDPKRVKRMSLSTRELLTKAAAFHFQSIPQQIKLAVK